MPECRRLLAGRFTGKDMRRYAAFMSAAVWGLILLARMLYPPENKYSIMTHTLSRLGSFSDRHNPDWWWLFSLSLLFWGISAVPVVLYFYRQFKEFSVRGARAGAALLLTGCAGIMVTGMFPSVRITVFNSLRVNVIHDNAAGIAFLATNLGIAWLGILLLGDTVVSRCRGRERVLAGRPLLYPYILWIAVISAAFYFRIRWNHSVYPMLEAEAAAAGKSIGSSWSEALSTPYSFPLWQHISVAAVFIFLVWFSIILSGSRRREDARAANGQTHSRGPVRPGGERCLSSSNGET